MFNESDVCHGEKKRRGRWDWMAAVFSMLDSGVWWRSVILLINLCFIPSFLHGQIPQIC